jgi:anti-anti-sigma factor
LIANLEAGISADTEAAPLPHIQVVEYPAGWAVVECEGEHDLTSRKEIASLLKRLLSNHELLVVDVTEAKFIDSSFITNLLIANRLAHEQGKRFRLQYATAPIVHRALEISGVLGELDCVHSREEALR